MDNMSHAHMAGAGFHKHAGNGRPLFSLICLCDIAVCISSYESLGSGSNPSPSSLLVVHLTVHFSFWAG